MDRLRLKKTFGITAFVLAVAVLNGCDGDSGSGQGGGNQPPPAGTADLTIRSTSAKVRPFQPRIYPVDVSFDVVNQGSAASGDYRLVVWLKHNAKTVYYPLADQKMGGLPAGGSFRFTKRHGVNEDDTGAYTLGIRIEPEGADSNTNNNEQEHPFDVLP